MDAMVIPLIHHLLPSGSPDADVVEADQISEDLPAVGIKGPDEDQILAVVFPVLVRQVNGPVNLRIAGKGKPEGIPDTRLRQNVHRLRPGAEDMVVQGRRRHDMAELRPGDIHGPQDGFDAHPLHADQRIAGDPVSPHG